MFKTKSIIYLIVFFPIFLLDIIFHKIYKKENSEISHQYMIRLFCFFGRKSNLIIKKILKENDLYQIEDYRQDNLNNLDKDGFIIKKNYISKNELNLIKNFLINECQGKYESDNVKDVQIQKVNLKNPLATTFRYNTNEILESEEIQKIIIDPKILSLCQNYFETIPIIDVISSWWSFPSKNPDNYSAQHWHFDLDRPQWLKLFIFLTDCGENNGAHKYIKSSHKSLDKKFLNMGYKRIKDEFIRDNFQKNEIVTMNAQEGSILIEDTLGLHKGQKLDEGNRLVLQIQYSSNLFGSKEIKKIKFPNRLSEEFLKYKNKFPKIFSNFYE